MKKQSFHKAYKKLSSQNIYSIYNYLTTLLPLLLCTNVLLHVNIISNLNIILLKRLESVSWRLKRPSMVRSRVQRRSTLVSVFRDIAPKTYSAWSLLFFFFFGPYFRPVPFSLIKRVLCKPSN